MITRADAISMALRDVARFPASFAIHRSVPYPDANLKKTEVLHRNMDRNMDNMDNMHGLHGNSLYDSPTKR